MFSHLSNVNQICHWNLELSGTFTEQTTPCTIICSTNEIDNYSLVPLVDMFVLSVVSNM